MNTEWWVTAPGCADLEWVEPQVREAEALFSRFRPDSLLSRLNRDRRLRDQRLAVLVARALELRRRTDGAFDPCVAPALEAAGYDRSFELLPRRSQHPPIAAPPVDDLGIAIDGDEVRLAGRGAIDLGGVAKGWTVDLVARELERRGCRNYVVDGGGDIRAGGVAPDGAPWAIGVGDGLAVRLRDRAVCTSSTARRRWQTATGEAHHIIDPRSGAPSRATSIGAAPRAAAPRTAVVVARDAATADALATALLADVERGLRGSARLRADVLIESGGRWELTAGMERWLM